MVHYQVFIEINGKHVPVGDIKGSNALTAGFQYDAQYMKQTGCRPISISLPFQEDRYDARRTRNFFEGLLPEGFTRKSVAGHLHVDSEDYLSILYGLGQECLGAIRIGLSGEALLDSRYDKITIEQMKELASEGATTSTELVTKAHLSLAGASGKVGLYLDPDHREWYLPIGLAASTHIVKQSHVRLKNLVANEQLSMMTAGKLGITIPESFIIETGCPSGEEVLFATKRYDRFIDDEAGTLCGLPVPYRLHQEDFSQALGIPALDKYEKQDDNYMLKAFELLRAYSVNPMVDQLELWDRLVFDYLIGNTDNHIKNFSLIYSKDMKQVRLSPAYDIVSTAIYDSCSKEMGMSVGGVYLLSDIKRESWINQTKKLKLGTKMAMKRFDQLAEQFVRCLEDSAAELAETGFSQAVSIKDRILAAGGIRYLS